MADNAGCVLHRLIVRGRGGRAAGVEHSSIRFVARFGSGVALEAKLVHVVASEHAGIGRSMRRVAECAAFSLDDGMLVDEGAGVLLVALDADRILLRGGLGHALLECAVRIVAVGALHQALIHLVMERLGEGGLYVLVALLAENLLRGFQELRIVLRAVNAMAGRADDLSLSVGGALEHLVIALVTGQAALLDLFRGGVGEAEDLGNISAGVNVLLAGPVTALASDSFAAVLERELGMRIAAEG